VKTCKEDVPADSIVVKKQDLFTLMGEAGRLNGDLDQCLKEKAK
jgi:hypothetical protein